MDQRDAGGRIACHDAGQVDGRLRECAQRRDSEPVGTADATEEMHVSTGAAGGERLIRAFAAGQHREPIALQCLTGLR